MNEISITFLFLHIKATQSKLTKTKIRIYKQFMKEINEDDLMMEQVLSDQIPDFDKVNEIPAETPTQAPATAASFIGQSLSHKPGGYAHVDKDETEKIISEKKLTRIGENIKQSAEIRDGWIDVDRRLLGERNIYYPTDWKFRIRPANVDAIRNWSTIDDENPNSIDDVFNEILKSCFAIVGPNGTPIPWGKVRSWDRFFFILLIRQYTFVNGEKFVKFDEDCPNCDNPVTFELKADSLDYDLPDPEVMHYFSQDEQVWIIDPAEFDINEEPITLYLPTLEKDAAIKSWLISRIQEKKKIDNVFVKFIPWLAPQISKDDKIASRQIREYEMKFKSWDIDMFSLMDDIIKNIQITPATTLKTTCPICGEETTAAIRFPNGIRGLFSLQSGHKKFGKK